MITTRGEMAESELRCEETAEKVPCGISRTISFFASDGELVRKDQVIEVDMKLFPGLAGLTGRKLYGTDPSNLQLVQDADPAGSS